MSSTRRPTHRRARLAVPALLVATAALGACDNALGPVVEQLDPVVASQRAEEIYTTMAGNPALASLAPLETASPFPAATAMMMATLPFAPSGDTPEWFGTRVERLAAAAPYFSPAEPAVIFPADLLGKTLCYNPTTGQYEVCGNDGPPNGVRFILYAIDPVFKRPMVDNPVGEALFMDESTPSADALHIIVKLGETPVIDYLATATVKAANGGTVVFGATGFIDDGSKRLTFELHQEISELAGVSFNYYLAIEGTDASVELSARAQPGQGVHIELTVREGRGSVQLVLDASETQLSGSVTLNGATEPAIVISGTPEEPVFTHPDGSPITEEEARALHQLFRLVDKLSEVVHALLRPAHRILNVPVFAI